MTHGSQFKTYNSLQNKASNMFVSLAEAVYSKILRKNVWRKTNAQISNIRIDILKIVQINYICNAYIYIQFIYFILLQELIFRSLCKWCGLHYFVG